MDRPVLHAFVDELLEDERLAAFAEALPTRARVSEPALPLLLASLHERLNRGLVCALPEDADARAAAAPRRRAGAGARRARSRRARLRLRDRARRGDAAGGRAA